MESSSLIFTDRQRRKLLASNYRDQYPWHYSRIFFFLKRLQKCRQCSSIIKRLSLMRYLLLSSHHCSSVQKPQKLFCLQPSSLYTNKSAKQVITCHFLVFVRVHQITPFRFFSHDSSISDYELLSHWNQLCPQETVPILFHCCCWTLCHLICLQISPRLLILNSLWSPQIFSSMNLFFTTGIMVT